jgi:hypothetical protein
VEKPPHFALAVVFAVACPFIVIPEGNLLLYLLLIRNEDLKQASAIVRSEERA